MRLPKLKICGVKSPDEARQLHDLGVDYLGLNFISSSKRYISLDTAQSIMAELKPGEAKTVGLFAGHTADEVNDYARQLGLDYVQLHGDEPADYARQIEAPLMRAIAIGLDYLTADIIEFINGYPADYFVIDRQVQGHGAPVNSELAAQITAAAPNKIFLAGGLTPDNLPVILAKVQPYGIDIAGGVRTTGDTLDMTKVTRCLKLIRQS
jgi:phosphoribosylanthranilate isomerase